ncbi:unnamed protein product [Musa acuminata subsp. malaccensis]|uniref:(wild Malaysian banana) hypothetical protein n=1 Tax=Musa acuminata subsp. malaccensis TaxID=214687 RepID=A0A804HNX4_MUSAM|nr:unnamed protein product [Musa acuminata subsp. malaccensis]
MLKCGLELTYTGLGRHVASHNKPPRDQAHERASERREREREIEACWRASPTPLPQRALPFRGRSPGQGPLRRLQSGRGNPEKLQTWKTCLADQRIHCNFSFLSDSITSPISSTALLILHSSGIWWVGRNRNAYSAWLRNQKAFIFFERELCHCLLELLMMHGWMVL